jgi:hypothetical protein
MTSGNVGQVQAAGLYSLITPLSTRWRWIGCTAPKLILSRLTCCSLSGSGSGVVFVDHATEYSVASNGQGDW